MTSCTAERLFEFFAGVPVVVGIVKRVVREFSEQAGVLMDLVIGHFIGGWGRNCPSPRPSERREVKRHDNFFLQEGYERLH